MVSIAKRGDVAARRDGLAWPAPTVALNDPLLGITISGLAGFAVFLWLYGDALLDPSYDQWVFLGDRAWHYLGWVAFRNEPWRFPLGAIHGFLAPVGGTTIAFMDSIPLLALPLKVVSPWLGDTFQYFGLWLAACYTLMSVFGYLLLRELGMPALTRYPGAVFFALSPALFWRQAQSHSSLLGQWLVVAALYLAVRQARRPRAGRWWTPWVLLAVTAALVNVYLLVMVMGFAVAAGATQALRARGPLPLAQLALIAAGPLAVLWLLGYFTVSSLAAQGFGFYSANLLAFFNPFGIPAILPRVPMSQGQGEGFAYLGAGALLVVGAALAAFAVRLATRAGRWPLWLAPLLAVAGIEWLFSLSSSVMVGETQVLDLSPLYAQFPDLAAPLRASGRFMWPAYYLLLALGIAGTVRLAPARFGAGLLAVALCLQLVDLRDVPEWSQRWRNYHGWYEAQSPVWETAPLTYRRLVSVPPEIGETSCGGAPVDNANLIREMRLAVKTGLPLNSGLVARAPVSKVPGLCSETVRSAQAGRLDEAAIYLRRPGFFDLTWDGLGEERVVCGAVDGIDVCVARERPSALRDLLLTQE